MVELSAANLYLMPYQRIFNNEKCTSIEKFSMLWYSNSQQAHNYTNRRTITGSKKGKSMNAVRNEKKIYFCTVFPNRYLFSVLSYVNMYIYSFMSIKIQPVYCVVMFQRVYLQFQVNQHSVWSALFINIHVNYQNNWEYGNIFWPNTFDRTPSNVCCIRLICL